MTRFEWDGLRVGDTLFVHHSAATHRRAEGGTVAFLEVQPRRGNKVGVRFGGGAGTDVVWPSWVECHLEAVGPGTTCWRCGDGERVPATPAAPAVPAVP
jgi:hypothetical protein